PIGGTLFGVQNSTGGTKYLDVTSAGISVAGTTTSSGAVNANGGVNVAAGQTILVNGGNTGSRPGSPTAGTLYYDTTTNQLIQYNGSKWVSDRSTTTKIVAASNS